MPWHRPDVSNTHCHTVDPRACSCQQSNAYVLVDLRLRHGIFSIDALTFKVSKLCVVCQKFFVEMFSQMIENSQNSQPMKT